MGAQLALINRLNIHSIGELEAKNEETQVAYDSVVREFNSISEKYHRLDDLLVQYNNLRDLEDKPHKSLAEKMKLQLAKQSLSRHGTIKQIGYSFKQFSVYHNYLHLNDWLNTFRICIIKFFQCFIYLIHVLHIEA